jgi:hypothetical protein
MKGVSMTRTRAWLLLGLAVVLFAGCASLGQTGNGSATPPQTGSLFTDVPKDHWAYDDLKYLVDRGIITGLPGGQYKGGEALDRYSAAALIARAIKYMQQNPESVTPQDLDVLKDLIFKVSDNLATLQTELRALQGGDGSTVDKRLTQNEKDVAQLKTQLEGLAGTDAAKLSSRLNTNFILSLTALLVAIIAVALATLGL